LVLTGQFFIENSVELEQEVA